MIASAPTPLPPRTSRRFHAVLALVLILGTAIGWYARQPDLGTGGDEATYLLLADALAEGRYHDEYILGQPRHAKYPPGMPAWLLAVRTVGGSDLDVARGANLLLLALAALVLAHVGRRLVSPAAGVALAAAVVGNPTLSGFAGTVLSEIPYILLTIVALVTLPHTRDRPGGRSVVIAASVAALAAFLTRSVGIAVLASVVITLLLQHRRWVAFLGLALLSVGVGGWVAYVRAASVDPLGRNYGGELQLSMEAVGGPGFFAQVVGHVKAYLVWVPSAQFGLPALPGTSLDNLAWAVIILAPATIGFVIAARRWTAALVHLVAYAALLVLWPHADARLAVPLLPFILVAFGLGIAQIARLLGSNSPARFAAGALALLAVIGAFEGIRKGRHLAPCRASPAYEDARCYEQATLDWASAARWLADSLPDDAVVATFQPAPLHLLTGRLTVPWERLYDSGADTLLAPRGRITHALLSTLGQQYFDVKTPWTLRTRCDDLHVVASPGKGTYLLSLLPADSGKSGPACELLPNR